jgi:FkbM family methyltransferase
MARKLKLFILNLLDIFHIFKIVPFRDFYSFFSTFYLQDSQKLIRIGIRPLNNKRVCIRRGSIIDRDVIKYVFYNQYHMPLSPLRPEAFILDLGSNIGLTLLHFKETYPHSNVMGYEMDKSNFEVALSNTRGLEGCSLYNLAVWKESAIVKYDADDYEDAFSVIAASDNSQLGKTSIKAAEAVTIDSIIEHHKLTKIDYLKMDIEGAEKDILLETPCEWLSIVQQLNIEIHDHNFCNEITKFLEDRGFRCRKDRVHSCLVRATREKLDHAADDKLFD